MVDRMFNVDGYICLGELWVIGNYLFLCEGIFVYLSFLIIRYFLLLLRVIFDILFFYVFLILY